MRSIPTARAARTRASLFSRRTTCAPTARPASAGEFSPALFKEPLTLEEYLSARPIAEPLHLFDCVMPCAGAEGFLVLSEDRAKALGVPFASLLGTIERHNAFAADPVQMT